MLIVGAQREDLAVHGKYRDTIIDLRSSPDNCVSPHGQTISGTTLRILCRVVAAILVCTALGAAFLPAASSVSSPTRAANTQLGTTGGMCTTMCGDLTNISEEWQLCVPGFVERNFVQTRTQPPPIPKGSTFQTRFKAFEKQCRQDSNCPSISLMKMMNKTFGRIKTSPVNQGFFQLTWVLASQSSSPVSYVTYQRWVPSVSTPMDFPTPAIQACGPLCGDVDAAMRTEGEWTPCQAGWVAATVCASTQMEQVVDLMPFSGHRNQSCISLSGAQDQSAGCIYFLYDKKGIHKWQQKYSSSGCDGTCENSAATYKSCATCGFVAPPWCNRPAV